MKLNLSLGELSDVELSELHESLERSYVTDVAKNEFGILDLTTYPTKEAAYRFGDYRPRLTLDLNNKKIIQNKQLLTD